MRIVQNTEMLSHFSSDHRLCRGRLRISLKHHKANTSERKHPRRYIIPRYVDEEAELKLKDKMKEIDVQPYSSLQENYEAIIEAVNCICEEFGKPKTNANKDGKLKKETNELIKKKAQMRAKCIKISINALS